MLSPIVYKKLRRNGCFEVINIMEKNQFELLAPAGSFEICRAVIEAGADAVYVGGSMYGARAYADNFTQEELLEALDHAHLRGKKIYLTINTLMKNAEIGQRLYDYLLPLYERGLDAVIVQDLGAVACIRGWFPHLPIHTSTQMTVTGTEGVRFLQEYGVTRVVMAREVSLEEMRHIHEQTGVEMEAFVHGALCYCYSGQCLFSSMLGGRSGNRGRCAQPCRMAYSVLNEDKKTLLSDSYVLSLKDLCGIGDLPALHRAGVYSLKIEGRMKQAAYAAGVVSYYRKYIDKYIEDTGKPEESYAVEAEDRQAVADLGNRCGFTNSYYRNHNGRDMITFRKPNYEKQNEALQTDILQRYAAAKPQLPVRGKAVFRLGEPAELTVSCGDKTVTVRGNVVEAARKAPVTKEELKQRLQKTGDTPFAFQELTVEAGDGIFLPNGAINRLRREGLQALQETLLEGYRRRAAKPEEDTADALLRKNGEPEGRKMLICSVASRRQLKPVLEYGKGMVDAVYLDTVMYSKRSFAGELKEDLSAIAKAGMQTYLTLPAIFRKEVSDFYHGLTGTFRALSFRGFVIRNYESLYWVRNTFGEKEIIADHNLYSYNDAAVQALHKKGITHDTVPLELNRNEILHRENAGSEMILYGYYPLMTSAQCIRRNTSGCDGKEGILYLKDRYQAQFAVWNHCSVCYNTIYNSLPTMLFPYERELERAGIRRFRLSFTVESPKEIIRVLEQYSCWKDGKGPQKDRNVPYTNGHYKRGVE